MRDLCSSLSIVLSMPNELDCLITAMLRMSCQSAKGPLFTFVNHVSPVKFLGMFSSYCLLKFLDQASQIEKVVQQLYLIPDKHSRDA